MGWVGPMVKITPSLCIEKFVARLEMFANKSRIAVYMA